MAGQVSLLKIGSPSRARLGTSFDNEGGRHDAPLASPMLLSLLSTLSLGRPVRRTPSFTSAERVGGDMKGNGEAAGAGYSFVAAWKEAPL